MFHLTTPNFAILYISKMQQIFHSSPNRCFRNSSPKISETKQLTHAPHGPVEFSKLSKSPTCLATPLPTAGLAPNDSHCCSPAPERWRKLAPGFTIRNGLINHLYINHHEWTLTSTQTRFMRQRFTASAGRPRSNSQGRGAPEARLLGH